MAKPRVSVGTSTLIQPANPTKRHRLPLPPVDTSCRDLPYFRVILFYKAEIEHVSVIAILKRGLSAVLLHFYPLAGRLVVEGHDGILALDCNDAGVEFVEASLDFPFSELEEDKFAMRDFFLDLGRFHQGQRRDNPEDPLLSVQVTRLLGGGIAVGCAFNHVAADGHSFWHFMNSWAECCRGLSVSVPPLHMRTALMPQQQTQMEAPDLKLPGEATDPSGSVLDDLELSDTVVHLTEDMIKRLKRSASAEAGNVPITSFQAMTAYLWKRLTMAQEPLEESQKLALLISVNVRGRMVPPLPAAYFGNALVSARVFTTAGELRRESLGATAARIHEAIRSVDAAHIQEELRRTDSRDYVLELIRTRRPIFVGMSPRFPVFDTDFGWGKPAAARSPMQGMLVMYPGKEDGSVVDVCLSLPTPKLDAFLSQEDEV